MTAIGELLARYEECLDRGVTALERGDTPGAKAHLLLAAERLLDIADATKPPDIRAARTDQAHALLDEVEALTGASDLRRERPGRGKQAVGEGGDEKAKRWEVTESPGVRFDDIAGLDDVKEVIRRRVIYPFQHPAAASRYKKRVGGGVLLYGPPGNGKTMLAKAIATELTARFFSVKCSDIMSKWVGEAEQNVAELFELARRSELAVVFFDETEALVSSRGKGSTVMDRVIPEFLSQVDGLNAGGNPILLLGATNRPWDMDDAALRPGRFGDELIYVGLPDDAARASILENQLAGVPKAETISVDVLVTRTTGFTGADLVALVARATDRPYSREVATGRRDALTFEDIESALRDTSPSVAKGMCQRYEKFAKTRS